MSLMQIEAGAVLDVTISKQGFTRPSMKAEAIQVTTLNGTKQGVSWRLFLCKDSRTQLGQHLFSELY